MQVLDCSPLFDAPSCRIHATARFSALVAGSTVASASAPKLELWLAKPSILGRAWWSFLARKLQRSRRICVVRLSFLLLLLLLLIVVLMPVLLVIVPVLLHPKRHLQHFALLLAADLFQREFGRLLLRNHHGRVYPVTRAQ